MYNKPHILRMPTKPKENISSKPLHSLKEIFVWLNPSPIKKYFIKSINVNSSFKLGQNDQVDEVNPSKRFKTII